MSGPLAGLHWSADGQATLWGPLLRGRDALDRVFAGWAAELGADEHRFPAFLPVAELDRLDYFGSFPHLVTFAATLDADPAALRAFASRHEVAPDGALEGAPLAPLRQVLTPAACYHFYVLWRGTAFASRRLATTVATCFRREEHYEPLRRQWNFSMREVVCIGTADEVAAFVGAFQERLAAVFAATGVRVSFEAATDPFFDARNPKFLAQRVDPVKLEMKYGDLAIGSLNLHRNFFGETFGLSRDGRPAFSGCVAFGLERWLYALSDTFGPDPARWPAALGGGA